MAIDSFYINQLSGEPYPDTFVNAAVSGQVIKFRPSKTKRTDKRSKHQTAHIKTGHRGPLKIDTAVLPSDTSISEQSSLTISVSGSRHHLTTVNTPSPNYVFKAITIATESTSARFESLSTECTIIDSNLVEQFLTKHNYLAAFIHECIAKIRTKFKTEELHLSLLHNPEEPDSDHLVLKIYTSLPFEEAIKFQHLESNCFVS